MRKKRGCCPTMAGTDHMPDCHSVDALTRMLLRQGCRNAPTQYCEVCRERYCMPCWEDHVHLPKAV